MANADMNKRYENNNRSSADVRRQQLRSNGAGARRAPQMNRTSRPESHADSNVPRRRVSPESRELVHTENKKMGKLETLKSDFAPMLHVKTSEGSIKTVRNREKKPFPVYAIVLCVMFTLLFMFILISNVQINEYTQQVSELKYELEELNSQSKELTLKLEQKNDLRTIEQYATDNLGMVKPDQLVTKHITISTEDKIDVVVPEPTQDDDIVTTAMSALLSNFSGLRDYMGAE